MYVCLAIAFIVLSSADSLSSRDPRSPLNFGSGGYEEYVLSNREIALQALQKNHLNMSFFLTSISNVDVLEGRINIAGTFVLEAQGPELNTSSTEWSFKTYSRGNETFFKTSTYSNGIDRFMPIELLNSRSSYSTDPSRVADITYHLNGTIIGVMPFLFRSTCNFDMTKFPNDKQTCYLDMKITTDVRSLDLAHVEFIGDRPENEIYEQAWGKTAWKINGVSMNKVKVDWFMGTHYERIFKTPVNEIQVLRIKVDFERHSAYYHRVFVGPIALVLLLLPVIFLLPPDSTEKLTYGAVLLLILIQEIRVVEQIFPPYTDEMPQLVRLTTSCAALAFFSILVASILSSLERNGRERPLPAWVKRYILGKLGPVLLVKEGNESVTTVHVTSNTDKDSTAIIHHEQEPDGFSNQNGGVHSRQETISSDVLEQSAAIMALVNELKLARLRKQRSEQWLNFFTVLNRLMFLLTLVIGIIFLFCFI